MSWGWDAGARAACGSTLVAVGFGVSQASHVTQLAAAGAPGVVVSSTGNHGAAIAAYAAHAGLPCIVFTLASVPLTMKAQMSAYGAMVVALEHPRDRWVLMRVAANALGWLPTSGYVWPPLGSPPFGMEGYKSIAYEIVDTLGAPPDWVVVPPSYGDGLYGTWKGFRELRDLGVIERTPRMAAAEPFGPLAETLRTGADSPVEVAAGPSVSFSIATPMGTFQALAALRESDGAAAATPDDEVVAMQLRLAALEGIYVEPSSAAGLVAIARLRRADRIGADDRVVVVLTSSGLKDPDTTARATPPVTVVKPDLDALREALRSTYAFTL